LDQDSLDMTKVEAKVRELAQLQADLRVARLRTIEQGKALLTPEQRTRLQAVLGTGRPPRASAGPGTRPEPGPGVPIDHPARRGGGGRAPGRWRCPGRWPGPASPGPRSRRPSPS